jgi:hypothetical protein
MAVVTRLVTFVDVEGIADAVQVSLSARHEAVLADGRRLLLLDDRGWTTRWRQLEGDVVDVWATLSVEDTERMARAVVGPDEPFDDHSYEDMAAHHWAALADDLRRQGVVVDPEELRQLPHDVVLSDRLLARIAS